MPKSRLIATQFLISPRCSDGDFIRRAYLDVIGLLPSPDESRAFLANPDPKKREKLIDSLLYDLRLRIVELERGAVVEERRGGRGKHGGRAALVVALLLNRDMRRGENLLAGVGSGLLIVIMWWVSGSLGFVAEHPETLEEVYLTTNSGRMESLSFVAPVAYLLDWLMFFSDTSKVLSLGIVSVLGVIAGSFVVSRLEGSFRW